MANCPHDVFIRRLAKELGVSLENAREVYEAMLHGKERTFP